MKELSNLTITKLVNEYSSMETKSSSSYTALLRKINQYIETKAVLGFDIYRYSQYPKLEQTLIPHIFKLIYDWSIDNCLLHEPFLFQEIDKKTFMNQFVDTGDGGFQIFENPLQAIIFSIYFQANIGRYNSGTTFTSSLKRLVGEITLRYSLTYDDVYYYERNFYGPSIINNSRIMSKDRLNRFLIDDNSAKWFKEQLNGLENLQIINYKSDFKNIPILKNIKEIKSVKTQSLIFDSESAKILKVDVLKIGEIKSKLDILSIHSLHLQVLMTGSSDKVDFKKYTISLGNLNSTGIAE